MTDLKTRFRTLDDLQPPDLWREIEAKATVAPDRDVRTLPWVLIAATLLLTLALGGAVLVGSGLVKLPVLPVLPDGSPAPTVSEASPIPILDGCVASVSWCQDIAAGTYVVSADSGPLPGLVLTLPAGWSLGEEIGNLAATVDGFWEFDLHRVGDENANDQLNFWGNVVAVDQTGQPATENGPAPEDLADYLAADPRLIVSERGTTTIGNGIPAITLVMRVDPTGPNDDPQGCPGASCANVLTILGYWSSPFRMTVNASDDPNLACPCSHAVRLYLLSVGPASDPRTVVVAVVVYAPDPDSELVFFQADVQPILDSIRLPAGIVTQP